MNQARNTLDSFLIRIAKVGRIPRHVAFILDGNRRYEEKNSLSFGLGHKAGYEKLEQVLSILTRMCSTGASISVSKQSQSSLSASKILDERL